MPKTSLNQLGRDASLILRLMIAGRIRWDPFTASRTGEICFNGLRYACSLENGQPQLCVTLRNQLMKLDAQTNP